MANRFDQIDRLKDLGLTRNQILDRLNGPNNRRNVTRAELNRIGMPTQRTNTILRRQRRGLEGWGAPDNSRSALEEARAARRSNTGGGGGESAPEDEGVFDDEREGYEEEDSREGESAFAIMAGLLDQYGLGSLTGYLRGLIEDGITDPASLQLRLQETAEWKQRFRGNELLKAQGLGVLSPGEYLNLESSYAEVLRRFGMPPGFFDTRESFANFIGNNVSPQELAERTQMAMDLANQVDPTQRETLRSMYGIGEGDIAAYFLDAKKAQPILQRQVQAVKVASAGKRAGLAVGDNRARFEDMVDRGVNEQMAQQGYANIANEFDPLRNLASIWGRGDDWTLAEAEDATFFGDAEAKRERQGLIQQERAAFSGASGFRAGVSGRRSSAGRF